MSTFNQHIITQRFVIILKYLKSEKIIKSYSEFCRNVDLLPQSLNEMLKNKRNVSISIMHKFFVIYKLDPNILFKEKQKDEKAYITNYIKNYVKNLKEPQNLNTKTHENKTVKEPVAECDNYFLKDETITAKDETITAKDETITAKDETITAKNETITAKDETITAKNETINALNQVVIVQQKITDNL